MIVPFCTASRGTSPSTTTVKAPDHLGRFFHHSPRATRLQKWPVPSQELYFQRNQLDFWQWLVLGHWLGCLVCHF
ncbi:hypothetical protein GDO81_009558 [Engystomops pustulosus]|uniref:Uncharacterized protein n=1 Tax=Engystomops pustulosus TaxID=76066 RepID=A0AAV7BSP0_ENGPU|nr:hypothetical protein GDO81_009558 [Engystomops pustulosus]